MVTMVRSKGLIKEFQGLSTDTRPKDDTIYRIGNGSTFMELNGQKRVFIYDSKNINPATGDNWWEV